MQKLTLSRKHDISADKGIKKKLDIAVLGEKKRLWQCFFNSTRQNRTQM